MQAEEQVGSWYSNPLGRSSAPAANGSSGVGRYLKLPAQPGGPAVQPTAGAAAAAADLNSQPPAKKAKQTQYGDFSGW